MTKNLFCLVIFTLLTIPFVLSQTTFSAKWDNGFKVQSDDGQFKLKFGGRIMYDFVAFGQDNDLESAFGEYKNGVEFRRLRFYHSGTVYSNLSYKLQLDFAGGKVSAEDVFIQIGKIPVIGNIRVGHFKEPFRLEVLTSSKYITFMERSLMTALSQERNTGLMVHNQTDNGHVNWQLGVFRNADSSGNDKDAGDGLTVGGRLAGIIPLMKEGDRDLLHLGASVSLRNPDNETYSISSRPETHLGPKYLSTGEIEEVDNVTLFGLEAALVLGSFSAQTEYAVSRVNLNPGSGTDSYSFLNYYAQVSYFITGESRKYKYKSAIEGFDRVKPNRNYGSNGPGAWELTLRYSASDWNDADILGGKLNDITLGLNWYLNPASRVMLNYILADLDAVGHANIFQTRFQVDF